MYCGIRLQPSSCKRTSAHTTGLFLQILTHIYSRSSSNPPEQFTSTFHKYCSLFCQTGSIFPKLKSPPSPHFYASQGLCQDERDPWNWQEWGIVHSHKIAADNDIIWVALLKLHNKLSAFSPPHIYGQVFTGLHPASPFHKWKGSTVKNVSAQFPGTPHHSSHNLVAIRILCETSPKTQGCGFWENGVQKFAFTS